MINIIVVCCILMLFDIISGITAAAKRNALSSTVMRDGLYHKASELILLGFSAFMMFILDMPPFDGIGIPPEVLYTIGGYIAVMEILSILENICKANPNIPIAKLMMVFNLDVKEKNDVE